MSDRSLGPGPPGMDFTGPPPIKLPPDAHGVEIFSDRETALNVVKKFKEISTSSASHDLFKANFDPTQPDALVQFEATRKSVEKMTLKELGLDSAITDWEKFPGILRAIFSKFWSDPMVMKEIMEFVTVVKRFGFDIKLGSEMEDVPLVTLANKEACVLGGTLQALFRDFKDQADFLCVYLAEAHPRKMWNFGQEFNKMEQHRTMQDRLTTARELMKIDAHHHQTFTDDVTSQSKLRLVADTIDNRFALTYDAHPDRVIAVEDGKAAFVGRDIEKQLLQPDVLMTEESRVWLQERFSAN